jgi:ABC-type phosphate transport system auxiliary subunit
VPVTARLSKSFYDRFGDDVANELVEWFNSVDATYRANLLEVNELNFARFDAKLEGLEVERQFVQVAGRFDKVDQRFDKIEERIVKFEERFVKIDERLAAIDRRFDSIEALLREQLMRIDGRLDRFEARMMRWMLTFWVGTLGGLAALVWAMVRPR